MLRDVAMSKKRRLGPTERWVQLKYWLLKSPAWRSLTGNAAKLSSRAGHAVQRQQQRPHSLQRARSGEGTECQLSDCYALAATPSRPRFHYLHEKGRVPLKAAPNASEWRLTEHRNASPPEHATKDFMRWQPAEPDLHALPKSRTRLLRRKRAFPPEKPHRCRGGNARAKKASPIVVVET